WGAAAVFRGQRTGQGVGADAERNGPRENRRPGSRRTGSLARRRRGRCPDRAQAAGPASDPGGGQESGRMTVYFIGAGPGDPDLITVRGRKLIERCPVCLYAGSLVP